MPERRLNTEQQKALQGFLTSGENSVRNLGRLVGENTEVYLYRGEPLLIKRKWFGTDATIIYSSESLPDLIAVGVLKMDDMIDPSLQASVSELAGLPPDPLSIE